MVEGDDELNIKYVLKITIDGISLTIPAFMV